MLTFEVTKEASVYVTTSLNNVPVDPTGLQVAIYYNDDVVIAATTPTKVSTGYYAYSFIVPSFLILHCIFCTRNSYHQINPIRIILV